MLQVRSRPAPEEDDDMDDERREQELALKRFKAQERADEEEQDAAAARVQASIRGRQARNDVKEYKEQEVASFSDSRSFTFSHLLAPFLTFSHLLLPFLRSRPPKCRRASGEGKRGRSSPRA